MNRAALLLVGLVAGSSAALAHHSHANLDRENVQVKTGVVTKYGWAMPHVFLKVRAPDSTGELVEYSIELLHPPGMFERGWTPDMFEPGERITWAGAVDRNPNRHYMGLEWVEKADGTRIENRRGSAAAVTPSTDFTGLWRRDSSFGQTYFPPVGWPLSEIGRELVAKFHPDQNPQLECTEPGPPKYMLLPYPVQITRPDDKTIIMRGELRPEPRIIHLDRDAPRGPASPIGHSVGRFEGNDLIVETSNFIADKWGTHTGIDSSDQKRLVERYVLADDGLSLKIYITVSDPVYLSEPFEFIYPMNKIADRGLVNAECTIESARLFLEGGYSND